MTNTNSHRSIGNIGEEIAKKYLEGKGYFFVEKNHQIKGGEIDLIMKKGNITYFFEVKYRRNESHGHPLDTMTTSKKRALRRTIMLYLIKNKIDIEYIQVDFIGIMPNNIGGHRVWHVKGIEI